MPLMSMRAFIIHLWCSCIPLKKQARKKLRTTWWQVNDKNNILDELLLSYSWNIKYTYIHISQSLRRNENRKKREMSECKSKSLTLSWRHFWDFYSLLPQRNSKQHAASTNVSFAPHLFLKKQYRSNVKDFSFLFAVGLQCFLSLLVFVQEAFLIQNMFV